MLTKENTKDWMKAHPVSNLPGRIRLSADGLKYLFEQRLEIAQALVEIAGVRRATVTPVTGTILLEYDMAALDSYEITEQADLVLARYSMPAMRARHAASKDAPAETPMTTKRLVKRLAVNAGALLLGNTLFTRPLLGGWAANFTSLEALAALGLTVHTGEKISVDGTVISGGAVIDQSAITGEFVPAEKREGTNVFAGTVVKTGNIHVRADKVGDQTVISRIVGMVEASELKKAPIQRYADRFSNYLVPLNFLLCAAVWLVTRNPQKALKMLVIDYSCGIKLSTATAFSAAINAAVRQGVLIKGGAYIEQMSGANTVLLDKTGTITEGKPRVVSMRTLVDDMDEREIVALAMAAEETSTHPLASAILSYGRGMKLAIPAHDEVITEVSRGSRTNVDGRTVRVGNLKYMTENGVKTGASLPDGGGAIPNYVGVDDRIVAVLFAMDSPRENVRRAINSLRYDGVGDIEMLTGDMDAQARAVAELVGADGYRAQLLPEQKAEAVLKLQTQGNGVVMVGDGINDAPALAYADVGISLGSKSTDIAMETSDVVINRDDPMMIPGLRRLSRATMNIVHQNFAMVIGINTVGLILGAASNISVMMSALMHNASTILVVANSLRLLFMSPKER